MLVIFQEEGLCDLHACRGMHVGYNMQLASGFMQLAAAGRKGTIKYIFAVFLKGNFNSALEWG